MGTRTAIAVTAVVVGAAVIVLSFVPYVALQYRRRGRFGAGRAVLAAGFVIYLLGLAGFVLLPLPADITALCAHGGVRAQLRPLYALDDIARGRTGDGLVSWLRSPPLVPLLFNVTLFVPLGMFVRHLFGRGRLVTLVIGLAVSLLVECTQLTGVWFLFPCAYRQFNVDDLIANTVGTGLGVLLAPLLRLIDRGGAASPDRPVTVWRRWLGMACDCVACGLTGIFLATLLPEIHLLATGRYLPSTGVLAVWFEPVVAWWVPALLLFLWPSLVGVGGSIGQRAVLLAPAVDDDGRPGLGRRLSRVLLGSGLYALLGGAATIGAAPADWPLVVLAVFVLVSLVAVGPTRGHRGLSMMLTGQVLADRAAPVQRHAERVP